MTDPVWSDPVVQTVAAGVHRAPVPLPADGLRAVNVYVVEDGDGVVMIDAGWDGELAREAVQAGLDVAGAELPDVRHLLITHMHYDHLGQATELVRAGAREYWLGQDEKESFTTLVTDPVSSRLARLDELEAHGAVDLAAAGRKRRGIPPGPVDWDPPSRWISEGDELPLPDAGGTLVAIATPGHTRGHVCFHDPERRLLFAGDHVLPHITPSIGLEPNTNPLALVDYLESLAKIATLDVDLVLPAHGDPFSDLAGRVGELISHHEVRLEACGSALSAEGSDAFTVATRVPWTRRETPYEGLNAFNQTLAVWETAAHLELLVVSGELHREVGEDGRVIYVPPPPVP